MQNSADESDEHEEPENDNDQLADIQGCRFILLVKNNNAVLLNRSTQAHQGGKEGKIIAPS